MEAAAVRSELQTENNWLQRFVHDTGLFKVDVFLIDADDDVVFFDATNCCCCVVVLFFVRLE